MTSFLVVSDPSPLKGWGGGRLLLSCHVWAQTCPLVCPSGRYLAPQGPKAKLPFYLHGLLKPPPLVKYLLESWTWNWETPAPFFFFPKPSAPYECQYSLPWSCHDLFLALMPFPPCGLVDYLRAMDGSMPVPRNQYRNCCQHRPFADKYTPDSSGYYRHRTRRISQDADMNLGYYETGCDNPFLPSY